jgi:hypothetical protein
MLSLIKKTISGAKEEFAYFSKSIIDLTVDNNSLENIPLIDQAIKILTIKDIYRKNKLKRNYQSFIKAIQEMDNNNIDKYYNILNSSKLSEEVSETIFEIITESEKPLKTEISGNLSLALSKSNITIDEYYTLLLIIQSSSIPALKSVKTFMEYTKNKGYINGLKSQIREEALLLSLGVANRFGSGLRLDENGKKLAEFGFKIKVSI